MCLLWSPAVDNIALINHAQRFKEIAQPGLTEDWQLSVHKIILVRSSKHSWYTYYDKQVSSSRHAVCAGYKLPDRNIMGSMCASTDETLI